MGDPTTTTDLVKELTEIAYQYLCERELQELNDSINANFARQPTTAEELSISRRIWELQLRPPARKRGRPPQQRDRHIQIAGAVAILVEEFGLHPTRSHFGRRRSGPSACSIVTAALDRLNEGLSERTVEGIWHRYRRSPLISYPKARDYIRNHYCLSSLIIR
jgi:hypothetical protein